MAASNLFSGTMSCPHFGRWYCPNPWILLILSLYIYICICIIIIYIYTYIIQYIDTFVGCSFWGATNYNPNDHHRFFLACTALLWAKAATSGHLYGHHGRDGATSLQTLGITWHPLAQWGVFDVFWSPSGAQKSWLQRWHSQRHLQRFVLQERRIHERVKAWIGMNVWNITIQEKENLAMASKSNKQKR